MSSPGVVAARIPEPRLTQEQRQAPPLVSAELGKAAELVGTDMAGEAHMDRDPQRTDKPSAPVNTEQDTWVSFLSGSYDTTAPLPDHYR